MVAVETPQPRSRVTARAVGLLGVLVASRVLALAGQSVPVSIWTPFALLWQDLAVVLVYALLDRRIEQIRQGGASWCLYGLLVAYAAINVPVARLLSSPLSWPMLRATRGTLADSIQHHVTTAHLGLVAAVLAVGLLTPFALRLRSARASRPLSLVAAGMLLIGFLANLGIDVRGRDRNAFSILLTTAFPRVREPRRDSLRVDWRESPVGEAERSGVAGESGLGSFRGRASGRNVVLVFLESTAAEYLKPHGASEDPMPRLGELFRQGIAFDAAYTTYPESIKSLVAVLCSRYPAMDARAEAHAGVRTASLAAILRERGYRTGLFHSGRFLYLGMESVLRDRGFEVLEDAGDIGGERESSFGVEEGAAVARVLEWIDEGGDDRPFLVAYLPVAGHHPYDTPEAGPFEDATERGRYLNALHYSDSAVGALVDGLRERGRLDDTLLVFFGDHGEAFGQHEGNYGHSLFIYEENVRVPLLFVLPGLIKSEQRSSSVVSLIDVAPTVLDLLGLSAPGDYQGSSLLDEKPRLALFFADYSMALVGLRDGPWKYIARLGGHDELYDLRRDPRERENLGEREPGRARAYRAHLEAWLAEQRRRVVSGGNDG